MCLDKKFSLPFYPVHTVVERGFYPGHAVVKRGFYPGHTLVERGFYPVHTVVERGFYPGHTVVERGFYPGHAVVKREVISLLLKTAKRNHFATLSFSRKHLNPIHSNVTSKSLKKTD